MNLPGFIQDFLVGEWEGGGKFWYAPNGYVTTLNFLTAELIMWYSVEVPLMVSEYKEILFIAISSFHMFKF